MRIFGILFFGIIFQYLLSFSLCAYTPKSELDWARFDHSRPPLSTPAVFVEYFEEITNALDGSTENSGRVNKYLSELKKQMRGHSEFAQLEWNYDYAIRLYRCAAKLYTYRSQQLTEPKEERNDLENYKDIFERIFSKIYAKGSLSFWEKRNQLKADLGDISLQSLQLLTEKFIVNTVFDKNFLKSVYSGLGWTRPSADDLFELARELRFSIHSVSSFVTLSLNQIYPSNGMAEFRYEIVQIQGPGLELWDIWSESASPEKQLKDFKILNIILNAPTTAAEMVRFYEQNIKDPELHMFLRSHLKAFLSWIQKNSNAEEARRIYRIATQFIQSPEVLSFIQTNAVEKAPSFTAVVNLIPSNPAEREEFIQIFSNEILSKPHSLAEFITAIKINPALDNGNLPQREAELILLEQLEFWASGRSYVDKRAATVEEPESPSHNPVRQQEIIKRLAFLASLPSLTGPTSNRRTLTNIPGKAAEIFLKEIAPISFSTQDDWINHLFKVSQLGHQEEINSEAIGTAVLYEIAYYLNHFLKNKPTLKMIAAIRFLTADAIKKIGDGITPNEIKMAENIRENLVFRGLSLARNESDFRGALLSDPLPTATGMSGAWAIGDREIYRLGFLNERSTAAVLAIKDLTKLAGGPELELDNLGFTGLRQLSEILRTSINVYRKKNPKLASKLDAKRIAIEKSGDRAPNPAIQELRLLHDTVFQLRNFYENPHNALKELLPSTSAGQDRDFRYGFIEEFEKLSKRAGEFIATPEMAIQWMEWICKNAGEEYKTYLIWNISYAAPRGAAPFSKMIYEGQRAIENIFKEGLKKFGLEFATAFAYQTVAGRALDKKREILWDILLQNIPHIISTDSSGKFLFEIARKYNETWKLHDHRKSHIANYSERLFTPKEKFQRPGSIREAAYIVNEIGLKDLAERVMVALFEKSADEKIILSATERVTELPKIKAALGKSVERLQVIDINGNTVLKLKSKILARVTQQVSTLQNRCHELIEKLKI